MSFIYYDIESSGTNKAYDQILQLAAIQTDDDLNEIDRFEIRSRLSPHIVPSPGALMVTGITIEQLLDPALPSHFEMVGETRRWLQDRCPSTFVAYNGHQFDEEFLRQAFYQCLHPPYLTNTNGSSRSDLLRLVRSVVILDPEALAFPRNDKSDPVLKLDQLAPANGFEHANAHDALADVEATIFIARLIKDRRRDLWEKFVAFSRKEVVSDFVAENETFLMLEGKTARGSGAAATKIGQHPQQAGNFFCFDLTADQADLEALNDEELAKRLMRSPRPVKRLKANSSPLLLRLEEVPDAVLGDRDRDEMKVRARQLQENWPLRDRLVQASLAIETVYPPSPHVEEQIYGGFPKPADQRHMTRFHEADWPERMEIGSAFEDRRLRLLAKRIVYFEKPNLLGDQERLAIEVGMARRMLGRSDVTGEWTTLQGAREELERLTAAGSASESIESIRAHFADLEAQCESRLKAD